ncbi:hypothetical protein D3C80_806830 [compost metagenome]
MEILPRPVGHEDRNGPAIWVDEAIWGHRLHDEQTPWLTVLEFLCVLQAEHAAGRALHEEGLNTLSYRPQTQMRLRNLVFNNPHLARLTEQSLGDNAAWEAWLKDMSASAGGLETADFSYLRKRFDSFDDFASVIRFLQKSSVEGDTNKRWSSKFLFPFGPSALFEDVSVSTSGGVTNDRRFFARTGELLYLMLARSTHRDRLREDLIAQFLNADSPYDRVLAALQSEAQHTKGDRAGAYLPCSQHTAFDRLASDWLAVLSRPMPISDALPHLVTLTGLNLLLYQLERAREVIGGGRPTFICEIVSPRKSVVRDLSADSFQNNASLPKQAIDRYIRAIADTAEWEAAATSDEPGLACAEVMLRQFDWPDPDDSEVRQQSPDSLIEQLIAKAHVRHNQHVGKIHGAWARAIGLASRRSSRRVRYAPTDRLLKSLVVCCVDDRMEFKLFLKLLYDRYGFIIGDHQARDIIDAGNADQEDFSNNARRLEERLASLGLVRRLSDSCAYVENPFTRDQA